MLPFRNDRLWIIIPLLMLLAAGCAGNETADHPDENGRQEQPAGPENPKDENEAPEQETSADSETIRIQPETALVLPGGEVRLEVADTRNKLRFETNRPEWVEIGTDGTVRVSDKTPIGETVIITVHDGDRSAKAQLTVAYSLEETLAASASPDSLPVVTNADSTAVLVNKERSLPADYRPGDLTEPDVPFSFDEQLEKRLLRKEAAEALEKLFAAAKEDNIALRAVSGFRSYERQKAIFEANVRNQGEEQARRFSAYPGTSEHQTGLAMDVSSPSVGNALEQSLGETREGKWLAENAHRFGFIIRYPKGKEAVTGYAWEPWHLRYVGEPMARDMYEQDLTLEEYFGQAVPVTGETGE